jgi:hypothetical protein
LERCTAQVYPAQIRPAQVCTIENDTAHIGVVEIRVAEIRVRQYAELDVDLSEAGASAVSIGQIDPAEPTKSNVGPSEAPTPHRRPDQDGAP